ncbi:MAG: T9SS type A sorting domain-containing protein [Saprospiraceae bacterium]|nr:T9SS type A sorting domain-containing protein [Saprospiraceae bacterium]
MQHILASGCNDVNAGHIDIDKYHNKTLLDLTKFRAFSILNYMSDAECRYRKVGGGAWIIAMSDCLKVNVPGVESILDCEFTLNTESGGVEYEYEIRVKCTLDGWGNWFSSKFNSYCGPEGIETNPSKIGATELEYSSTIAEEGRLSRDGGQTFFKIETYQNNKIRFENLEPNTQYWFKCRTKCDYNSQWSAFTPLKSVHTSCNEPQASNLITYGANMGINLGIRCERNADRYEFNIRRKGESQWRTSGPTQNDSYIFPDNVAKGDIYQFRCKLECGGTWTPYSVIIEGMIPVQCPQPVKSEIGVNQITNNSAHLFCRSGHGGNVVEKHIFRYREQNGSTWTTKRTENNEVDISRLNGNTEYVMEVQHECTNGVTGNWSGTINFKTDQACNVNNSAVRFANISYNSVDLICDQTERDGYEWEVKRVRDGRKSNVANPILQNVYTHLGLDQGEEYAVRLKVTCGAEKSEWTQEKFFTTSSCLAPNLNEISITDIENHNAVFRFSGNSQSGLEWQYRQVGNPNWRRLITNQNDILLDSLVGNSNYECRLRIKCSEIPLINSNYSSIVFFSTTCDSRILRFSAITPTTITVHASDVGASQYIFKLIQESGSTLERMSNSPVYTFTALVPATDYEFQVKAICNGNGNFSISSFASTEEIVPMQCLAPTRGQMSTSNVTISSVQLNCSKGNVDGFYFRYGTIGTLVESGLLTEGTYAVSGLRPGTIYGYQCRVKCGATLSPWSDTVYFRTQTQAFAISTGCPPPYEKELYAFNIGNTNSALICYTEADQFQFRYKDTASTQWIDLPIQKTNFTSLNTLSPETIYEYQCKIECNGSFGFYSASRYFKTLSLNECLSSDKENFAAINIRKNEATLLSLNQAKLYKFRYKEILDETWIFTDTSSSPLVKINQLKPNSFYIYQVQTLCANNKISSFSTSRFFKTREDCQFDTLQDVGVFVVNDTIISLQVNQQNYFRIEIRYREKGMTDWILKSFSKGDIPILEIQVKKNVKYELQGLVYCADNNNSQWSESRIFSTLGNTANKNFEFTTIKIFPNPGNGLLDLDLPLSAQVQVYDSYGKLEYVFHLDEGLGSVDISKLHQGVYYLKIGSKSFTKCIRYIKI